MDDAVKAIYNKHAKVLVDRITKVYTDNNIIATGDFAKKLTYQITQMGFVINPVNYSSFIDNGRAPGKRPPIPSIIRWLENKKGLPPSMLRDKKRTAFAIATKIAKEGIKVPNQYNSGQLITNVVNEYMANDVQQLLQELELHYKTTLQYDIFQVFKN